MHLLVGQLPLSFYPFVSSGPVFHRADPMLCFQRVLCNVRWNRRYFQCTHWILLWWIGVFIFLDVSRLGRIWKTYLMHFESLLIFTLEFCMCNNNFQIAIFCLHFRMVMLEGEVCLSLCLVSITGIHGIHLLDYAVEKQCLSCFSCNGLWIKMSKTLKRERISLIRL